MTAPTAALLPTPFQLHVPDEPVPGRHRWYAMALAGVPLDEVLLGDGGVAGWLWERWRVLERAGCTEEHFTALVRGYRRELWLWLAGERAWDHCCSELIGRIARRVSA